MSDRGTWHWFERRTGLVAGFTRRDHGASTGPYAGLNLALHVGDDDVAVRANRASVLEELARLGRLSTGSVRALFMDQVHGARVRVVTREQDLAEPTPPSDALITTLTGVALFTLVADCTPVLLADRRAGVVAAVHAGRPGMLAGVVPETVAAMRSLGARRVRAVVGPSVCGRCYEVPPEMRADAVRIEPACAAVTREGTPAIDVAAGVVAQLRRHGVSPTVVSGCSRESEDLYSYRRDGRTGRFAGVIMQTEA